MKKILIGISALLILVLTTGCTEVTEPRSVSSIKNEGILVVGVRTDTVPFGYKDPEDDTIKGFEIDLAHKLAEYLSTPNQPVTAKVTEVNAKTRVKLLQDGAVDLLIATMTDTKERRKEIRFSTPYFRSNQSILVLGSSNIKTPKDTSGKLVATLKGAVSGINFAKKYPLADLLYFENYPDTFTALRAKRVHAITTDRGVLLGMKAQGQNGEFRLIEGDFTEECYGIGIAKQNKELAKTVEKFLQTIWQNGTYQRLYKKWFKVEAAKNVMPFPLKKCGG
ncbi:MAG: hypothetical protein RLZ12_505 [Bacillota bacterium]